MSIRLLLLSLSLMLGVFKHGHGLHPSVLNYPSQNSVLWGCAGLPIDDCCRIYIWSIWYPYNVSLPADDIRNIRALDPIIEAYLGMESMTSSTTSLTLTRLGCVLQKGV